MLVRFMVLTGHEGVYVEQSLAAVVERGLSATHGSIKGEDIQSWQLNYELRVAMTNTPREPNDTFSVITWDDL